MSDNVQEEYVHPVIAAMQNAYQQMQGAKKQQFDQALATKESDLRQAQFDELQKQHGLDEKHANEQHDINLGVLDMQRRQHALDNAKSVQDFINSGGKGNAAPDLNIPGLRTQLPPGPNGEISQPQQAPNVSLPQPNLRQIPGTDVNYDPSSFSSVDENQQRLLQNIIGQTTAQTTAQQTALQPFKTADEQRQQAARLSEIDLQGRNANAVAATNHAREIELENLRGHFQLAAAGIAHQQGREDLAPVYNGALNSIMDGQTSYSTLPKDIKEGVSKLAATKGWALPTNQKDYSTKLNAATGVQSLLDQYKELAINNSRDSPDTGLLGKASAFITGGGAVPGTDLRSKIDALKANGGALASFFDQQNRKSDAEILRQVVGLFDPRATTQQNLDKIQQHIAPLNAAVRGVFAGFKPDQLNYVLGNRGLKDIGGYKVRQTGIKLDDGTTIPDTPQNRQLHNIPLNQNPE